MSLDLMWQPKLPRMELIPPVDADVEGVFREEGPFKNRIIYTEKVLDVDATKASGKIRVDADGNEVWKKNQNTGEKMYPMMDKEVKWKQIRYILVPNERARTVKKVQNFEMTAKERETLRRREEERTFLDEFIAASLDEGLSPADLVRQLKQATLGANETEESVNLSVDGEEITEDVIAAKMAALEVDTGMVERVDDDLVSVDEEGRVIDLEEDEG